MQENIIDYLKERFDPDAIILHGSRARKMEREHSDWDFILLYANDRERPPAGRELLLQQNIEFQAVSLPIRDIVDTFGAKLQEALVVFEKTNLGSNLLKQAALTYEQGVSWSEEKIRNHELWTQGRIDGMRDSIQEPLIFNKYFSDFYSRIFNYWYWVKKKQYSQPVYVALKDIEKDDREFSVLVNQLVSENSLEKKVEICNKIKHCLFSK